MIVNTSTDDFLCEYSHIELYRDLCTYLKKYFDITTEEGSKLMYLNLRIIQTVYGVSFDQTDHIQRTIVDKFFPPETTEILKSVHTPFRTDSQYELDLAEQLPATDSQLSALIKKYGGSFGEIIGQIMHVFVFTRCDLGFTCTRLARYIQSPSAASFAGLYRALRYLATHTHRPIFYPRKQSIDGFHTLRVDYDTPKFEAIQLPNGFLLMIDSDHARDNRTRKSCTSIKALMIGVIFDWKMEQQKVVALHSTDSETRGVFAGTKRGLTLQAIAEFLGFPNKNIYPTPIYEDSQPCIDILQANTVTTRVKHIAVPIHFIHHQIAMKKFTMVKIGTQLNLADSGTKPTPGPTHFRHFDQSIGVRFYPPLESEHHDLLELSKFIPSPFATSAPDKAPVAKT